MNTKSFQELLQADFAVTYLSAYKTVSNPFRKFRCNRNMRPNSRFFYIEKGEFVLAEDGCKPIIMHPGDLLYLPGGTSYSSEWTSEEIGYYSAEFELFDGERFELSDKICVILSDKGKLALDMMSRLYKVWTGGGLGHKMKARQYFFELLYHIALENVKHSLNKQGGEISSAVLYIENNYTLNFKVSALSKMCHMSESSFRAKFQSLFGMPPITYRNFLRINKAAELLSAGDYTVSEVSELVGFNDIAYFNRVFKSFTHKNPSSLL